MALPEGRELFNRTYDEALSVALATGAQPETMLVEPIPPGWHADGVASEGRDTWITKILMAYGDVTPSMLQDIRRGRRTEIEFINGYVVNMARQFGLDAPINATIVEPFMQSQAADSLRIPGCWRKCSRRALINEQYHGKTAHFMSCLKLKKRNTGITLE